jgi:hypothetical protein
MLHREQIHLEEIDLAGFRKKLQELEERRAEK